MPRKERTVERKSLVAAAKNYGGAKKASSSKDRVKPGESWQHDSWDFFDMVPEFHQGCTMMGALLSRARLMPMERDENGVWVETENEVVRAAVDELFGGPEGHPEMLRQFGIHLSVAGEGWLVVPDKDDATADDWLVAAATEISSSGGEWKVAGKEVDAAAAIRIWNRHPRNPKKAQAAARAILGSLSELHQLNKRIAAQIDSRLFGAGILLVPSETSFPSTPTTTTNPGDPESPARGVAAGDAQGLADLIYETAQYAVQNPESAAAMIPLIGEAPGEHIDKVKHLTFWSELDRTAPRMREELRREIAIGLDIPAEILLGGGGQNRWNMWLSDENSVKIHAEPTLKILTSALTTGYLRPAIEGDVDDVSKFAIGADTSQMRMRPNRSKEALELNDRLILSDAAALRENGFVDSDLMNDEDRAIALARKAASGSTTPEIVEAALRKLGLDLEVQITDSREPVEARPTPSLREHPTRELPNVESASGVNLQALTLVSEQIVDRALQRAGNRIRSKMSLKNAGAANRLYMSVSLSPSDLDDILQDAWSACDEFDYGVPPRELARALDTYTRSLLLAKREPSRSGISATLRLLMDRSAA